MFEAFLRDPTNSEAASLIREDLYRVNDIAQVGMSTLVAAAERFGVSLVSDETPEALALRLFVDHEEAFSFAWSLHLLYGSGGSVSVYSLPARPLNPTSHDIQTLQLAVRSWFGDQAKGEQCHVRCYDEEDDLIILVQHGNYMKAVSLWRGEVLDMSTFRPAVEDVLVYERASGLLRIKAPSPRDQREYLVMFCSILMSDATLADAAERDAVFSLAPIQQGTFDYGGDGAITRVEPVWARLKLAGAARTVIEIKATNVERAFSFDLPGLSLRSGILVAIRLRFYIREFGHPATTLTFSIIPPGRTDLAERRHADLVLRYLEREGVKLK